MRSRSEFMQRFGLLPITCRVERLEEKSFQTLERKENIEEDTTLCHTVIKKVHQVLLIGNVRMVIQVCS